MIPNTKHVTIWVITKNRFKFDVVTSILAKSLGIRFGSPYVVWINKCGMGDTPFLPQILIFHFYALKYTQLHDNTLKYCRNAQNNTILGLKYIFWAYFCYNGFTGKFPRKWISELIGHSATKIIRGNVDFIRKYWKTCLPIKNMPKHIF